MENEIKKLLYEGWDGLTAIFGIITIMLSVLLAACIVYAIFLCCKIGVSYVQEMLANRTIRKLWKTGIEKYK